MMIIPVGERYQQNLVRVTKRNGELVKEPLQATLFVPMTGTAEENRAVLADPTRPKIANGDFEEVFGDEHLPVGWHYLRNVQLQGRWRWESLSFVRKCMSPANRPVPCKVSHSMVAKCQQVRLTARVRGENLGPNPAEGQFPAIVLTFYDERRAVIENHILGPWQASFDWRTEVKDFRVPPTCREAIVRLGLLGGVGKLDVDKVRLQLAPTP